MNDAQTLALIRRVADAAYFFDGVRATLPERDKEKAEQHVEHLHDAAQILAGDDNPQIYPPDDAEFNDDEHYNTHLLINRSSIELSHWRRKDTPYGAVSTGIVICSHPLAMRIFPTPTELRQLAVALKQLADDAEASAAQVEQEAPASIAAHG